MEPLLTFAELASLMSSRAGVAIDAAELERRSDSAFTELGLDSLGLLGIVGELENRHGSVPSGAEMCRTPGEFVELVNQSMPAGA
ncbi:phosphopantetheine-binding protein [Streptomyces sp. NPDC059506]|uniref:Acyl carrier protein n=1 Tax=Streptomyces thermolineatus TaxID=44033 RepID=A0ABN3LL52_9ACTN|nr:phosphopantetheine-binding protein [Streptomyces sp. HB2AG]MCZ2524625.1 phosphopantetheine-binding protein [Streptomyces sp. HB2AG]